MKPLSLYLANVKFFQNNQSKVRPVLILSVSSKSFIAYKITTKFRNKTSAIKKHYYKIANWRESGLNYQSYIDTYRAVKLNKHRIVNNYPLGHLDELDIIRLYKFIKEHNF